MSNVTGGETELAVGDTIQLDKGLHIVEAVGNKSADCLPLDDKNNGKPRTVQNPFPRHLVISRGGQPALDEFLDKKVEAAAQPKVKKGFVLLEPGDRLCHGGEMRTVVRVLGKRCIIGNLDGQEFYEDRQVNEFLLLECCTHKYIRLDPAQRAANLEQFLAQRKSPLPEAQTSDETTENESEKPMAKKTKAVKASQPKRAAEQIKEGKEKVKNSRSLFGSSICRVAMTAGAHDVSCESFLKVLKQHNLALSEATIKHNLRIGKAGLMKGAELTKAQLAEFNS